MSQPDWTAEIWKSINDAVYEAICKTRVAQHVFTTIPCDPPGSVSVPNEIIDFSDLSMLDTPGKVLVELSIEFSLTSTQASELNQKTCKTLAGMFAKALALAEDTVFFQGQGGIKQLGAHVTAANLGSAGGGLLQEANPSDADNGDPTKVTEPITVDLVSRGPGVLYGENVFTAVASGIANLTAKSQPPDYALFLPTAVYADTYATPGEGSLVTTAERIASLVQHVKVTGTLPPDQGLLVALAGDPTVLYLDKEASTHWVREESTPKGTKHFFDITERIQFVVRDPRSLVLLKFVQPK